MCAVRSVSSSASLECASPSHLTNFVSRSFRIFAGGMSMVPFVRSRGSGRSAAVTQLQLAINRREHGLAAAVTGFVEPHCGEVGPVRGPGSRNHIPGAQAGVSVPRLGDGDRCPGAVFGTGLGDLAHELGLFGDMNGGGA